MVLLTVIVGIESLTLISVLGITSILYIISSRRNVCTSGF